MRHLARSLSRTAVTLTLLLLPLASTAVADCTAPSSPGVRICSPTQNATLVYVPFIDFNSTPTPGAAIVKVIVYDNNQKTFEGYNYQTGASLLDASIRNGYHNVVINAWDSNGNLYQGRVQFYVIGDGYSLFCPLPSSPGINFCAPPSGTILGARYRVGASARGTSSIAAMRLYVDGQAQDTQYNTNQFNATASVGAQGDHTVAIVAWDNSGNVYTNTRLIRSTYTYSWVDCPPRGGTCSAGFTTPSPAVNEYVGNSFTIRAEILNNPRPITAIKAYVGSTLVATSNGPVMNYPVANIPSGTQVLTLQAWDTAGVLYRVQYNINVNVPH